MIPSLIATNLRTGQGNLQLPERPKRPTKYPRSTTIMEEIFVRKSAKIIPSKKVPKFNTLPDQHNLKEYTVKEVLSAEKSPGRKESKMDSFTLDNIAKNRRRSSWSVMKNLIKGLNGLMNPQVLFIKNEKELENNIKSDLTTPVKIFKNSRRSLNLGDANTFILENADNKIMANNDKTELFHIMKQRERFFKLLQNGSMRDIEKIKDFLKKDPTRFMRSNSDPERLINKPNPEGRTPLYLACLHGNLEVSFLLLLQKLFRKLVKVLLEFQANPHSLSKNGPIMDSILAVSARWNHIRIVNHLLKNVNWSSEEMKFALRHATNANEKIMRMLRSQQKPEKKSFIQKCFPCFF